MIYNITILATSLEFIDDINMSTDTYMHRVIPSNNIATVRAMTRKMQNTSGYQFDLIIDLEID